MENVVPRGKKNAQWLFVKRKELLNERILRKFILLSLQVTHAHKTNLFLASYFIIFGQKTPKKH